MLLLAETPVTRNLLQFYVMLQSKCSCLSSTIYLRLLFYDIYVSIAQAIVYDPINADIQRESN